MDCDADFAGLIAACIVLADVLNFFSVYALFVLALVGTETDMEGSVAQ